MSEKLPKGWVKATLGEIAEPSRARALPTNFPAMRYVGLEHIESKTMRLIRHGYASEVHSSSVRFSEGDVLYGRMRPYLNKIWVAEFEGLCSAEFLVFPKCDGLNNQFLAMRLNADDFVLFANRQVSGERPRVGFVKLSRFPILLPPTTEQEKIVTKLKAALSGMERAEAAASRAIKRLKRYRTAVLDAAIKGELTHDWRKAHFKSERQNAVNGETLGQRLLALRRARWEEIELQRLRASGKKIKDDKWKSRYSEPKLPKTRKLSQLPDGWVLAGWEQIGLSHNGRPFPSKEYSESGVKLVRPGNLYPDGSVRWTEKNTRYLPLKWEKKYPDLIIHGNELIINLTAQSLKDEFLGRVCLTSEGEHCLLNQRLARLTPVLGIPKFFLYIFKASVFRQFVDGLNSGSLIQHIFTSQLAQFALPVPPEAEQTEIVYQVDCRLLAADKMVAKWEQQLGRPMRQSLLHEAFTGRLVSQNPKDEPASILLERIRLTRDAEAQKPKGKHMPKLKSKSVVPRRLLLDVLRENKKPMTPEQLFCEAGFEPSQVDHFYRELALLRGQLREQRSKASESKLWPQRAHVFLQLKKGSGK